MKDRVSTNVLSNGALRYGIYDANGNLLRYEYIKPEDAPTEVGTALNKANLLTDATAAAIGPQVTTPNEAFAKLHADDVSNFSSLSNSLSTNVDTLTSKIDTINSNLNTQISNSLKIQTGSYTGTTASSYSATKSLTFNIVPSFLIIFAKTLSKQDPFLWVPGFSVTNQWAGSSGTSFSLSFTLSGKKLSWTATTSGTSSAASYAYNAADINYSWMALGV